MAPEWVYSTNALVPDGGSLPHGINRFAAIVAYDGHQYCGFQRQKHSPTVQQELECALSYVANKPTVLAAAGRTDSGVHSTHQVIHFDTPACRSSSNWLHGVNSRLPQAISLAWAGSVGAGFHARFSAVSRTYRYVIARAENRPAILANAVTWIKYPLDTQAMASACQYLFGERDFSAFRGANCQSNSPFRQVTQARVYESGDLIVFEISANAFVLHMVRNIVGALLEIGFRRRPPHWVEELLIDKDRRKSAATAPARGLSLVAVDYPDGHGLPNLRRGPFFVNELVATPVD